MLYLKTWLNIFRDGKEYAIKFENGNTEPLKQIGKTKKTGTKITFLLQRKFFHL